MDIIKFNSGHPTRLTKAEIVNDYQTITWTERYREPSEFVITASSDSPIREQLPLGSIISHVDTSNAMMVENHEISTSKDSEGTLTISGRSFEAFLENRFYNPFMHLPITYGFTPIGGMYSWELAQNLINNTFGLYYNDSQQPYYPASPQDNIEWLWIMISDKLPPPPPYDDETGLRPPYGADFDVKIGEDLHTSVLNILNVDDLGMKVVRPGPWSPIWTHDYWGEIMATNPEQNMQDYTALFLYTGVDRSNTVAFTYAAGDIESADYLWSNKSFKNSALVMGKTSHDFRYPDDPGAERTYWEFLFENVRNGTYYDRKYMYLDGSELDDLPEWFYLSPEDRDRWYERRDQILTMFRTRANQTLAAQKETVLGKVEISPESMHYQYRVDYDIGDIVSVETPYSEDVKFRVIEYVEIEDENGESGHPTLSAPIPPVSYKP